MIATIPRPRFPQCPCCDKTVQKKTFNKQQLILRTLRGDGAQRLYEGLVLSPMRVAILGPMKLAHCDVACMRQLVQATETEQATQLLLIKVV